MDPRSLFKAVAEGLKIKIFLIFLPKKIGKILEVLHFIMLLKLVISHKEKNGLLRKYNIKILGGPIVAHPQTNTSRFSLQKLEEFVEKLY